MYRLLISLILIPVMLQADIDTLNHRDSVYDTYLSISTNACCGEIPDEPCSHINLGGATDFRIGTVSSTHHVALLGFHLGGRTLEEDDTVFLHIYCYSDYNADSTLPLQINLMKADIVTVYGDSLHWKYGHGTVMSCASDINDSSPTGTYRIKDYNNSSQVLWGESRAGKKNVDFYTDNPDSMTLNGTSWHKIDITNVVQMAIDSSLTYCDMRLGDSAAWIYMGLPPHAMAGTSSGYMYFSSMEHGTAAQHPYITFHSPSDETTTARRRRNMGGN